MRPNFRTLNRWLRGESPNLQALADEFPLNSEVLLGGTPFRVVFWNDGGERDLIYVSPFSLDTNFREAMECAVAVTADEARGVAASRFDISDEALAAILAEIDAEVEACGGRENAERIFAAEAGRELAASDGTFPVAPPASHCQPEFAIGQRVAVRFPAFTAPRAGRVVAYHLPADGGPLCYVLDDGGLFSAYELKPVGPTDNEALPDR